jgi:hypothetical protein
LAAVEAALARTFVLAVTGSFGCGPMVELASEFGDPEDQSVTETCRQVALCGGVIRSDKCELDLSDMVKDGRVSQERAVTCAVCMRNNECPEIRELRHCDVACDGVSYVENLRTSYEVRVSLCEDVLSSCESDTDASSSAGACIDSLQGTLEKSPTLDAEVELCAECVEQAGNDAMASTDATSLCTSLIARCEEGCAKVGVIAEALAEAEARIEETQALARLCATALSCESPDALPPDCTARLAAQLHEPDGGAELATLVGPCTTCLELLSCDVTTRLAECSPSCGSFAFTER